MNNEVHIVATNDVNEENFTEMQQTLYMVPEELNDKEAISITKSPFYYEENQVMTYSSESIVEMQYTTPHRNKDETYIYTPSNEYHRLMHVYVSVKLPYIKISSEYEDRVQIKLCKNPMHNIVKSALLKIQNMNGGYVQHINTFFLDGYRIKDCLNVKNWDYMVGNRKELSTWSNLLTTSDDLVLPLPFFIDCSSQYSIPLHMFSTSEGVKISICYMLQLDSIIRMRVKDNKGVWIDIPPNIIFLDNNVSELNIPKVWGVYRTLTTGQLIEEKKGFSVLISDFKYIEEKKVTNNFTIDLTDERRSIRGLRYGFLNFKSSIYNNHSNYSLDHLSEKLNINPLEEYSLSHGNIPRITKRAAIHSTSVSNHYNFINSCVDNTINDISFDFSSYNIHSDTSVRLDKSCILSGKLKNNPSLLLEDLEYNKNIKIKHTDTPDQIIDKILNNFLNNVNDKYKDDSITNYFIFKCYCRFFKRLTFKVGSVVVED